MRGPIHVVPNGLDATPPIRAPRDPDPTIAVVSRLVPHKRVDLLLGQLAPVAQAVPRLRVDIVGSGPERARLQGLSAELGLQPTWSRSTASSPTTPATPCWSAPG